MKKTRYIICVILLSIYSMTIAQDFSGNFQLQKETGMITLILNKDDIGNYNGQGGSGDNFWSTRFSAGNYDSNNQRGYVSVPGYGPIGYGFKNY